MLDFAIAASQLPPAPLSSSIASIEARYPQATIMVGLEKVDAETAPFLDAAHPNVVQVSADGLGAIRTALVERALSRYVLWLSPGTELTPNSGLDAAIRAMEHSNIGLLFPTVRAREGTGPWTTRQIAQQHRVYRIAENRDGQVSYALVATPNGEDADLERPQPADVGGEAFMIDTDQIGWGKAVDWDPQFTAALENRDLFASVAAIPEMQARHLPSFELERTAVNPVSSGGAHDAMLAAFLHKWRIHTEQFGNAEAIKYMRPGRYGGVGINMGRLRVARAAVGANRRDSTPIRESLAIALSKTSFNPYVVSKSPDMLIDNMVVARDGSWIYVPAYGCGEEAIEAWLTELETGLPPRANGGDDSSDPNRLIRAREIGVAETVKLIKSRETVKFTFVNNPYLRIVGTYYDRYVERPLSSPSAEALRNLNLQRDPLEAVEAYDFARFLENVVEQKEPDRHRQWRALNKALAWGAVPYDFVGRVATIDHDLGRLASLLDRRPPQGGAALSSTMDPAKFARIDGPAYLDERAVKLIRRAYRDDFEKLDYSTALPTLSEGAR